MSKEVAIPDVGIVEISKKKNARKIKLRVHPEKGVLVTIPYFSRYKDGIRFANQNIDWIKERLSILNQNNSPNSFSAESKFITRKHSIAFEVDARYDLKAKITGSELIFLYNPLKIDFENKDTQTFIKKVILKLLKLESDFLIEKIAQISQQINLIPTNVKVGSAGTRWGSCNSKNEIILSCRMLLLPDHLIDYIIIHELCHITHKNHSKDFHDLLDKFVNGKSKILNKELKSHSIQIKSGDYSYKSTLQ